MVKSQSLYLLSYTSLCYLERPFDTWRDKIRENPKQQASIVSLTRKLVDVKTVGKAKKNDNSGIRTHALDGPAPEAGALDHSATLSLLMIYGTQVA